MTGDHTEPPSTIDAVDDAPLSNTDPTWRDDNSAADNSAGDDADPERTIDADADLIEHVRDAARAARSGLAAPPATPTHERPARPADEPPPAPTADEPAAEPPVTTGIDPSLPAPPAGVPTAPPPADTAAALPPPSLEPPPAPAAAPAAARPVATASAGPVSSRRWQPPARLRPAEVRATTPLIPDRAPKRGHLDRRWALVGVVVAAVVGFLIALAVTGGDDAPDPPPGPTTVPGASTTGSTP